VTGKKWYMTCHTPDGTRWELFSVVVMYAVVSLVFEPVNQIFKEADLGCFVMSSLLRVLSVWFLKLTYMLLSATTHANWIMTYHTGISFTKKLLFLLTVIG
jgi:hypothetical protein